MVVIFFHYVSSEFILLNYFGLCFQAEHQDQSTKEKFLYRFSKFRTHRPRCFARCWPQYHREDGGDAKHCGICVVTLQRGDHPGGANAGTHHGGGARPKASAIPSNYLQYEKYNASTISPNARFRCKKLTSHSHFTAVERICSHQPKPIC